MASHVCACPHCGNEDRQPEHFVFQDVVCPTCSQTYTLMPSTHLRAALAKRFPIVPFVLVTVIGTILALMGMLVYVIANIRIGC